MYVRTFARLTDASQTQRSISQSTGMMEGSIRHIEVFSYGELVHLTVSVDEEIRCRFMEAMGPSSPGLVGVHGIPHLHSLREALLPLAPILALSSHQERSTILKV